MAFGRISETPLGRSSVGLLTGDFNGDGVNDLAAYGVSQITVFYEPADSLTRPPMQLRITETIDQIVAADCNGDGISDIVILTAQPRHVRVYLSTQDTITFRWSLPIDDPVTNLRIADVTNDRRADILLFGRKTLGVLLLRGNGNGTFRIQKPLLPDHSLSSLSIIDLNQDRLPDLVGIDWIKNEILVFSGIARLRYRTASALPLEDEANSLITADFDADGNIDFIVRYDNEVGIFLGDGFGGFAIERRFRFAGTSTRFALDDVNEDGRVDIVVLCEQEQLMQVLFNDGDGGIGRMTSYAAGERPVDLLLYRRNETEPPRAAILDRGRRQLLTVFPAAGDAPNPVDQSYVTGLQPSAIAVFDANADGNQDILIANKIEGGLSIFLNRGDGTFLGQLSVPFPPNARQLVVERIDDTVFVVMATHPEEEKLSITRIHSRVFDAERVTITSNKNPEIVKISYDLRANSLRLVVTGVAIAGAVTVSEIREIARGRFVERTLFSTPAEHLSLAADIVDNPLTGEEDIGYLATDSKRQNLFFYYVRNESPGLRGIPRLCFSIGDTAVRSARLWLRKDRQQRIPAGLLQVNGSQNWLGLFQDVSDTSYSAPYERFNQVSTISRTSISFADIDRDGSTDFLVANDLVKSIQVFMAEGKFRYAQPKRLVGFTGTGGLAISDFNKDGILDYAVLYSESGVLRVYLGR